LGEVREGERNRGLILVPAREKGRVLAHTRLAGDGQMGGKFPRRVNGKRRVTLQLPAYYVASDARWEKKPPTSG